jgi:hypothetical protein
MNAGMGIAVGALALSIAETLHGTAAGVAGTADFHLAFWLIALVALLGVMDSIWLARNAGAHLLAKS